MPPEHLWPGGWQVPAARGPTLQRVRNLTDRPEPDGAVTLSVSGGYMLAQPRRQNKRPGRVLKRSHQCLGRLGEGS